MSYNHLSIVEREMILLYLTQGLSLCQIAKLLGRNKSTISREQCRKHKLLENPELFALVKKMFLGCHWSPEQIANRLKLEDYPIQISYKTIYPPVNIQSKCNWIYNVKVDTKKEI